MTGTDSAARPALPPARQLSLLATWAPVAAVAFGLLAICSVVATVRNLLVLVGTFADVGGASVPLLAPLIGTVVSAAVGVVSGLVAHRLGVEVPRVLRGWRAALAERATLEPGHERTGSRTPPR